jgi:hypothetical protein
VVDGDRFAAVVMVTGVLELLVGSNPAQHTHFWAGRRLDGAA